MTACAGGTADGVEAILFDAGNTLVFVDAERLRGLLRSAGVEVAPGRFESAELAARLALTRRIVETDRPTGTEAHVWREYFGTILRSCEVPDEATAEVGEAVRKLHEADHLWTGVDEATPATLELLRDAGYRLGVVSNADGRVPALLERLGLARHLDVIVDSGRVGVEKPDPRIFHIALDHLDLPPSRCLYVGDLYPVDVVGARAAGLRALLVDPYDAFGDRDVDRIRGVRELPRYLDVAESERPRTA